MTDHGYMKNKIKQYEKDYENIKNMYDITGSIIRACKNLNMSKIHYYYICDKYNLPRLVNKSINNKKNNNNQKGGHININDKDFQKDKKINKNKNISNVNELKKYSNIKLISNNNTTTKNNNNMSDNILITQNKYINDNDKNNNNKQKEKYKELCLKYINDVYNSKIINSHQ